MNFWKCIRIFSASIKRENPPPQIVDKLAQNYDTDPVIIKG